jgi:16S rRNA (uracil1498-N3)-methyltransferase
VAKLRRFTVESLDGMAAGSEFLLSADESRHVRVLRLKPGTEFEALDRRGQCARAVIDADSQHGVRARIVAFEKAPPVAQRVKLVLAIAWPKGKRAAVLVEKCAELGVDELVPIRFERGVVSKDDESEGLVRLRRIAAEASKQSGRDDILNIAAEMTLPDFLTQSLSAGLTFMLDPGADMHLLTAVANLPETAECLSLVIGPEGGLTSSEIALAGGMGIDKVRLAVHVLRIETAAIAAGAICKALLKT